MAEWRSNVFVRIPQNYQPDTLDLNADSEAAGYWFPCLSDMIQKFATQAGDSVTDSRNDSKGTNNSNGNFIDAKERAKLYLDSYLKYLNEYQLKRESDKTQGKVLGIRELLELNDKLLRIHGFDDLWLDCKKTENVAALQLFNNRLKEIDAIEDHDERWFQLVRGVLAGNMFDWGAQAVVNVIREDNDFGLDAALKHIQNRPWLVDNLNEWRKRLRNDPHKCAAIFVDNSGVDIILGVIPFARELLKRGTKVLLCANSEPSLNDVTSTELIEILNRCSSLCNICKQAIIEKQLLVYDNGQSGPCLDMRTLPQELCDALETHKTDLLIIEGMGRALHTNLNSRFDCETLKLAVVKNRWLAQRLGGEIFAVICKYEPLS